jgi:tetratricopeptide (TPR) repeat protein
MIIMNLVAPLALLAFLRAGSRTARVLTAFWLVMYALALPFSSSRGGWVGTAAWVGTFSLLWLVQEGRWLRWLQFLRRRLVVAVPLAAALLIAGGLAALKFYQMFAGSHPSHGSGTNLNRELMWGGALEIWQSSPWIGSGLGRLGLEYLRVTNTFPAAWWPPHAHSTPFQILGETGLAGFLPFLALCAAALVLFARAFRAAPASERLWAAASLAAFASAFTHGFFDDFTFLPMFLSLLAVNAALLLTAAGPAGRYTRIPLLSLAVPAAAALAIGVFYLWGYAPLYRVTSQGSITDWPAAAAAAQESARRDPSMPYYHSQAGLAHAQAWQQTGDPAHLELARQYLAASLQGEPNSSLFWADLAVLHWHAGDAEQALSAIQRAIALSTREPQFYINYGWLLEQMDRPEEAVAQYQLALAINPRLAGHPFWSASSARSQAAAQFMPAAEQPAYHWEISQRSLNAGDLAQAQLELAVSGLFDESPTAQAVTLAALNLARTSAPADHDPFEGFLPAVESGYWGNTQEERPYNHYFWRRGLMTFVVPGYIRVSEDTGQFDMLRRLHAAQSAARQCEQAAFTWQVLQREMFAGERPAGGYPPAPVCP